MNAQQKQIASSCWFNRPHSHIDRLLGKSGHSGINSESNRIESSRVESQLPNAQSKQMRAATCCCGVVWRNCDIFKCDLLCLPAQQPYSNWHLPNVNRRLLFACPVRAFALNQNRLQLSIFHFHSVSNTLKCFPAMICSVSCPALDGIRLKTAKLPETTCKLWTIAWPGIGH